MSTPPADADPAATYPLDRAALVAVVVDAVRDRPDVLAAWEGGSAAWGRADRWSDADVQLLAADDEPATIDAIFEAVERALASGGGGITHRFHVPEPAWHGHAQRFYRVAAAGPFVMLDLVVVRPGVPERFLAPEQHGHARVLFDRGAPGAPHTAPPPFDTTAHRARMRRAYDDAVARFDLFQPLVVKDIARGRLIDAVSFFHGLTLRPLVTLLGLRHRPLRFDFGNRYLHADLPPADAARLADLFCVRDLTDLADKHNAACRWFHALARELDVEGMSFEVREGRVAEGIDFVLPVVETGD
ncbi:MAG: hypothetical protein IT332_10115 [Ardenticatenales bacterium]|nr:hypothetical protein [Ardenticatenales bacterium]